MIRLRKTIFGGGVASGRIVRGLSPVAWFRFGQGITVSTGVSQWSDQSGNGNHLVQATAGSQPAKQADGSILFDGVDDFLQCAFTLNQPESVYLLAQQVSWTSNDYIFDGLTSGQGRVLQSGTTPQIVLNAGTSLAANGDWAVGTYAVLTAIFNGASSSCQINNGTAITGNAGTNNMSGLTLGANPVPTGWGNIQVKEVIVFPAAHDATTQARVIRYLGTIR